MAEGGSSESGRLVTPMTRPRDSSPSMSASSCATTRRSTLGANNDSVDWHSEWPPLSRMVTRHNHQCLVFSGATNLDLDQLPLMYFLSR